MPSRTGTVIRARAGRRTGRLPRPAGGPSFRARMPSATRSSIALVTCAEYPALPPDDLLLAAALERRGLLPVPARWDDRALRGEAHAAVVLRATWDYHHRATEFERWLERLERSGARVLNAVPTIRWNMRKTYLRDLEAAGLKVAGTVWAATGSTVTLRDIAERTGWDTMVVKPTISSTGWETWLVERAGVAADEERFAHLLAERDLMVQPFLPAILTEGETSLIFLEGRFSHAVRKRAAPGEFRVHEEHGGTVEREHPAAQLVRDGERALGAIPAALGRPLYARVDGVPAEGRLVVTELELIEPALYFTFDPPAADRMADALAGRVKNRV